MEDWKPFGDECPRCGNSAEVLTASTKEYYAYEDDDVRCVECGLIGVVYVAEENEGGAWVSWNEFDDED